MKKAAISTSDFRQRGAENLSLLRPIEANISRRNVSEENLTSILNKLHAMQACGFITLKQIATKIKHHQNRVSEWVTQRTRRPSGDVAFALLAFAAEQTIRMAASPRKAQRAYREAYKAACEKFPTTGER